MTAPQHVKVFDYVTASLVNDMIDYYSSSFGPWTPYTPVLTASSSNPTLGFAFMDSGRYKKIGNTVVGDAYVQFGVSGNSPGSGPYTVSLPVPPTAPSISPIIGDVFLTCGGQATRGFALIAAGQALLRYTTAAVNGSLATVTDSTPNVWIASDSIRVHFQYEAG